MRIANASVHIPRCLAVGADILTRVDTLMTMPAHVEDVNDRRRLRLLYLTHRKPPITRIARAAAITKDAYRAR